MSTEVNTGNIVHLKINLKAFSSRCHFVFLKTLIREYKIETIGAVLILGVFLRVFHTDLKHLSLQLDAKGITHFLELSSPVVILIKGYFAVVALKLIYVQIRKTNLNLRLVQDRMELLKMENQRLRYKDQVEILTSFIEQKLEQELEKSRSSKLFNDFSVHLVIKSLVHDETGMVKAEVPVLKGAYNEFCTYSRELLGWLEPVELIKGKTDLPKDSQVLGDFMLATAQLNAVGQSLRMFSFVGGHKNPTIRDDLDTVVFVFQIVDHIYRRAFINSGFSMIVLEDFRKRLFEMFSNFELVDLTWGDACENFEKVRH